MLKCPICNKPFVDKLELKTKPTIFLCMEHGLFSLVNNKLEPTKYPCPKCRSSYYSPIKHENGYAICVCPIHGEYRVSYRVSFNFRRLCSIVASKPNKSPSYYTPPERKVKRVLDSFGLIENKDYYHNKPFKNNDNGSIYYPDFVLEYPIKAVIEVDPSIWHTRWNRETSDYKKKIYFKKLGYTYVSLNERDDYNKRVYKLLRGDKNDKV